MAKKTLSPADLLPPDTAAADQPPVATETIENAASVHAAPTPEPKVAPVSDLLITITVPRGPDSDGYVPQHVQTQLDHRQGSNLGRLFRALDAAGTRTANGRRVASKSDAIRWLLEQIE